MIHCDIDFLLSLSSFYIHVLLYPFISIELNRITPSSSVCNDTHKLGFKNVLLNLRAITNGGHLTIHSHKVGVRDSS